MPEEPEQQKQADATSTPPQQPAPPTQERKPEASSDQPLGPEGEKALDAFKQRAREAEKQAKELQAKVQEFEDRDRTEEERAKAEAITARREAEAATAEAMRLRVAVRKGVPANLVNRIQGSNEAELEADADELMKLVGGQQPQADLAPGARQTSTDAGDMDSRIRRAAGRA